MAKGIQVTNARAGLSFGGILGGIGDFVKDIIPGSIDDAIIDRIIPKKQTCSPGFVRNASGQCVQGGGGTGVMRRPTGPVALPQIPFFGGPTSAPTMPMIPQSGGTMVAPFPTSVTVQKCPKFMDGKTGILWMHPISGALSCLPRGVDGKKFGMKRKNPKQQRAYISAAEHRQMKRVGRLQQKAKAFAIESGFKCTKK